MTSAREDRDNTVEREGSEKSGWGKLGQEILGHKPTCLTWQGNTEDGVKGN